MKTLTVLKKVALVVPLVALAAGVEAQRGRSSGSSRGSVSTRSAGSSGGSRSTPSISRPTRSIGSSIGRTSIGRSIGSTVGRSGSTRTAAPISRGTTFGRSGGRTSVRYVTPTTTRGTPTYRAPTISGRSTRDTGPTYTSPTSTRYSPTTTSGARGGYSSGTPSSGSSLYGSRGYSGRSYAGGAGSPSQSPVTLDAPSPVPPTGHPYVEPAAPSRSRGFPRAYTPRTYTPRSYTPRGDAGSTRTTPASPRSAPRVPRDVSDIAARYRSGDVGRSRGGTLSGGTRSGGTRGAPTGGAGGDAPDDAGDSGGAGGAGPAGRRGGGRTSPSPGSNTPASAVPTGLVNVPDGAYKAGPAGRLDPANRPRGGDSGAIAGRRGGRVSEPGNVVPGATGGSGASAPVPGSSGYVTPGGTPIVTTPTISKAVHHGYHHGHGGHFDHGGHHGYYGHHGYSPFSYWGWYAWCAPYYYYDWYVRWRYPSHSYVYVNYPSSIAVYETAGYESPAQEIVYVDEPRTFATGEEMPPLELTAAAERYLELGDRAFREGRYGDAVHFYAKATEFASDEGVMYLVLSDALFATGDYHYAAYVVRKALELDPTLIDHPVDKHGFYSDPAEFDRQLDLLEQYVRDHPNDTDSRLVLALNLLFGARPGEAFNVLESSYSAALRQDPAAQRVREVAERLVGTR